MNGNSMPFLFRSGTSDVWMINSIFGDKEYDLPIADFKPKLILDCGGNIGCAAVYFAIQYPDAQIYSVEPDIINFGILDVNTSFYKNIHAINSAVWDKETYVRITNKEIDNSIGFMTAETTENEPDALKTVTISKLLQESGFNEIDLLKIDIEGAEKELFSAPDVDEWLSKVKVLTIELHDRMKRGCSYAFFKAISKYHWYFAFNGENLIFVRENN